MKIQIFYMQINVKNLIKEILNMENLELKERFIDEKTGIEYIRKGDYYFPNLIYSASVKANEHGKYGIRFYGLKTN